MDGLNYDAQVMTKHLTQCLINLRSERLTPQPLTKLTLDHVKGRLDIGSLVIVLQELRSIHHVEVIHPRPQLRLRLIA